MKVIMLAFLLISCGNPFQTKRTKVIEVQDGKGCSVENKEDSSLITCPDGTTAEVKNGEKGADGKQGAAGSAGRNGSPGSRGPSGSDGTSGENGTDGEGMVIIEERECTGEYRITRYRWPQIFRITTYQTGNVFYRFSNRRIIRSTGVTDLRWRDSLWWTSDVSEAIVRAGVFDAQPEEGFDRVLFTSIEYGDTFYGDCIIL